MFKVYNYHIKVSFLKGLSACSTDQKVIMEYEYSNLISKKFWLCGIFLYGYWLYLQTNENSRSLTMLH